MRSCRHCAHDNADHLAYCSQCGRKLARTDTVMPAVWRATGNGAAYSHTVLATPGFVYVPVRDAHRIARHLDVEDGPLELIRRMPDGTRVGDPTSDECRADL